MMNCEQVREQYLDYAYDELDGERRAGLEAHLRECAECRLGLEDLNITRSFLGAWTDPPLEAPRLVFRAANGEPRPRRATPRWLPWAAAAAAAVLAVGLFGWLWPVSVRYQDRVVEIHLGQPAGPVAGPSAASADQLQTLIAESEARQSQRFMNLLQDVYYRVEEDRLKDRQTIQQGFDLIKEIYMDQIEKNNQFLEYSLQQSNYHPPSGTK